MHYNLLEVVVRREGRGGYATIEEKKGNEDGQQRKNIMLRRIGTMINIQLLALSFSSVAIMVHQLVSSSSNPTKTMINHGISHPTKATT